MPLALRDLQAAFAAHLVGADRADLPRSWPPRSWPPRSWATRSRQRRGCASIAIMCSRAWARPWPRPSRRSRPLVGAEFFRGLARAFIGRSLPTQPVLAEYGAGFPAFIAGHDAARDLPYLADVARLDWALNLAFHAPAGGRLAAADLAALPADRLPSLRLSLAPGTVLVCSPYPLDRIWAASQPGAAAGSGRPRGRRRAPSRPAPARRCGVREPVGRRGGLRRRPRRGADLGGGGQPGRNRLRPVSCLRPPARSGRLCCAATWLALLAP